MITRKKLHIDAWARIKSLGEAARNELDEVSVSDLVLAKQYEVMIVPFRAAAPVKARLRRDVDLTADDRLHARILAGKIKRDRTVQHAVVGDRDRVVTAFLHPRRDILHAARAV